MPTDTSTDTSTDASTARSDSTGARRARGAVFLLGAVLVVALIETETLRFYWLPLLLGLTYLVAAAVGRSTGVLWGPGFVTTSVGLAAALWLREGRLTGDFQFLAIVVMALGFGGVVASLFARLRGFTIDAISVGAPVLAFGAFSLLEQQGVSPVAGQSWVYAGLLAAWGLYELRPARTGASS